MKPVVRVGLFSVFTFLSMTSTALAEWDDGWWMLDFNDTPAAPLNPLHVGIDLGDGNGFSFLLLTDDDGDGTIHLPRLPAGGGLALGVDVDGSGCCDIWDLLGPDVQGSSTPIMHPLLIVAEEVEGEAFGMDSGAFPLPPLRTLVPGERLTATNGILADWPDLRLANGSDPSSLADFIATVGTRPNFTGDVIVTSLIVTGTFVVPEPGGMALLVAGIIVLAGGRLRQRLCNA